MSRWRDRYQCPVCGRHVAGWNDPGVAIECENPDGQVEVYHRACWDKALDESTPEEPE